MVNAIPAVVAVNPAKVFRYVFRPNVRRPARPFALGLFVQRAARLPIGPTDADRRSAAAILNAGSPGHASDSEWADEVEKRTGTASDYRAFRAELAASLARRYALAEAAEMAEVGMVPTDAELERMADESAWSDAYDRGLAIR